MTVYDMKRECLQCRGRGEFDCCGDSHCMAVTTCPLCHGSGRYTVARQSGSCDPRVSLVGAPLGIDPSLIDPPGGDR